MPGVFLTQEQRERFGRYVETPGHEDLERYFYLSDDDLGVIGALRGRHNRLGYAVQLTTLRYLGAFPDDFTAIPEVVLHSLARQLEISDPDCIQRYAENWRYERHAVDIQARYGYRVFTEVGVGLRLSRWLYALCWTGTDRPGELFKRATTWLLANKVLLPGVTVLERFITQLRSRVEKYLWRTLARNVAPDQRRRLQELLKVAEGERASRLEKLRTGPVKVSGPSLIRSLKRLEDARSLEIRLPSSARIPPGRIAVLARYANTVKATAVNRLPASRRLATLVAFAVCLEATANDDVLELLEALLRDLFSKAEKADKKARLRSLKDLDSSAAMLADACAVIVDTSIDDIDVRSRLFADLPCDVLSQALEAVRALIRPPDDVLFRALDERYRSVRRYLPHLLATMRFDSNTAGESVLRALEWLRNNLVNPPRQPEEPPDDVVPKSWKKYVGRKGEFNLHAYVFCVLDVLKEAISRRDVFVSPSWRYADPRLGLLEGEEWLAARPVICRSLGLTVDAKSTLSLLIAELEATWQAVAARISENTAVRLTETAEGKTELSVSPLEKLEEPPSLVQLRKAVADLMPRVDLPEILLETSARTGFTSFFTHVSEGNARAENLGISLCAVLLQYRSGAPDSFRHARVATRPAGMGKAELHPRRNFDGRQCRSCTRAKQTCSCPHVGRRRSGFRRWHALRRAGSDHSCGAKPQILRAWQRAHLVQCAVRPVIRTERYSRARHPAGQLGPAGRDAGTADRSSTDADHDRHGRIQRRGIRPVPFAGVPFLPAPGGRRRHTVLARSVGLQLWRA